MSILFIHSSVSPVLYDYFNTVLSEVQLLSLELESQKMGLTFFALL
jgi:hypothetical protein